MEKIHENLEVLKEQIQSTNQSLVDQSMIGFSNPETSHIARTAVHRLNSPDLVTQRNNSRGDAVSLSSPRVTSAFGRLQ